jgi:hypothetical protein
MAKYKCHECGKESAKKGDCPECAIPLEGECGVCGQGLDYCTCTGDIASTKEPRQKH